VERFIYPDIASLRKLFDDLAAKGKRFLAWS